MLDLLFLATLTVSFEHLKKSFFFSVENLQIREFQGLVQKIKCEIFAKRFFHFAGNPRKNNFLKDQLITLLFCQE